jgi:hypothetical protein
MSKWYPCVYCNEDLHCTKFAEPGYEDSCWCVCGPCSEETPSNGDLFRRMSDEEIVDWLLNSFEGGCPEGRHWLSGDCHVPEDCPGCWLEWLKKPANKGD